MMKEHLSALSTPAKHTDFLLNSYSRDFSQSQTNEMSQNSTDYNPPSNASFSESSDCIDSDVTPDSLKSPASVDSWDSGFRTYPSGSSSSRTPSECSEPFHTPVRKFDKDSTLSLQTSNTGLSSELIEAGWRQFWSRREKRPYYFNKFSKESLWDFPQVADSKVSLGKDNANDQHTAFPAYSRNDPLGLNTATNEKDLKRRHSFDHTSESGSSTKIQKSSFSSLLNFSASSSSRHLTSPLQHSNRKSGISSSQAVFRCTDWNLSVRSNAIIFERPASTNLLPPHPDIEFMRSDLMINDIMKSLTDFLNKYDITAPSEFLERWLICRNCHVILKRGEVKARGSDNFNNYEDNDDVDDDSAEERLEIDQDDETKNENEYLHDCFFGHSKYNNDEEDDSATDAINNTHLDNHNNNNDRAHNQQNIFSNNIFIRDLMTCIPVQLTDLGVGDVDSSVNNDTIRGFLYKYANGAKKMAELKSMSLEGRKCIKWAVEEIFSWLRKRNFASVRAYIDQLRYLQRQCSHYIRDAIRPSLMSLRTQLTNILESGSSKILSCHQNIQKSNNISEVTRSSLPPIRKNHRVFCYPRLIANPSPFLPIPSRAFAPVPPSTTTPSPFHSSSLSDSSSSKQSHHDQRQQLLSTSSTSPHTMMTAHVDGSNGSGSFIREKSSPSRDGGLMISPIASNNDNSQQRRETTTGHGFVSPTSSGLASTSIKKSGDHHFSIPESPDWHRSRRLSATSATSSSPNPSSHRMFAVTGGGAISDLIATSDFNDQYFNHYVILSYNNQPQYQKYEIFISDVDPIGGNRSVESPTVMKISALHFHKLEQLYRINCKDDPRFDLLLGRIWCLLKRYQLLHHSIPETFEIMENSSEQNAFSANLKSSPLRHTTDRDSFHLDDETHWPNIYQVSLDSKFIRTIHRLFDVTFECFASPLNCYFAQFCSLYPDTDGYFGSRGSLWDFHPLSGSFMAHPPLIPEIYDLMLEHFENLLSSSDGPLSFIVIVMEKINTDFNISEDRKSEHEGDNGSSVSSSSSTNNDNNDGETKVASSEDSEKEDVEKFGSFFNNIKNSAFVREHIVQTDGTFVLRSGWFHMMCRRKYTESGSRHITCYFSPKNYRMHIYILQNNLGHSKWTPTSEKMKQLRQSLIWNFSK